MSARMNYLGYFTDDESTAVHEAGHAVAAIRAGWLFSHIELTDPDDDDEKWRQQDGAFVWHPDKEIAWDMRQPLYTGMFAGDETVRRSLVIHTLAGAVANRLLCDCYDDLKPFPSVPDVNILEETGHYPPGTRGFLFKWCMEFPRSATREADLEAQLDAIFAPDLPMVETFVIENQRAIGDVANELWHRTWQRPDGESWRDLPYDEISAIVTASRSA